MKKIGVVIVFSMFSTVVFSQGTSIYSLFVNVVNEDFKFPLVGFVNIAKGDHKSPQIGFVNVNSGSFTGLQTGFINMVGDSLNGAQIGFVNTVIKGTNGAQISFVNNAINDVHGLQLGFVNISAKKLNGLQLGFVNYADTIVKGIPIGFLSIVRHGGYKSIEYSFSEYYPVTIGFKTGVEKFYTTIFVAYNPFQKLEMNSFAMGLGLGTIVPIKKSFFFNPELSTLNTFGKNNNQLTSFIPFFGYNFNPHFGITAGPSVTWNKNNDYSDLLKPFLKIANFEINDNNAITVGARVGVRYRF